MKSRKHAFTLIELLVVIAIIALLAGLLFPALKAANAARDESVALSNMRQIGMAFNLYANDNSYMLPSRVTSSNSTSPNKWPALLANYLSDLRVYASQVDTQNWIIRGLTTAQVLSNSGNNTSFIMNGYNDEGTLQTPDTPVPIRMNQFPSTSDIIILGTPIIGSRQYYMDFEEPPNGNQNDALWLNAFNGGSNYLFADGSARFITQAAYQAPDPADPAQHYGDDLWLVNKSYLIPKIGNGGPN